ncbi:hypothetical protein, partial [Kaistella sp.]|uniref:hypothetical protein n=1 Tax=Kaistella sp. TaxID=2782235 RepID=UPI003C417C27
SGTTWNNNNDGSFTNNWGDTMSNDGIGMNFNSSTGFYGGRGGAYSSGGGYIDIPSITLTGGKQVQSHFNSFMDGWNAKSDFAWDRMTNAGRYNDGGVMMMDSMWDVLGIAIANMKPENKQAAMLFGAAALLITRNPSVLKAELGAERAGAYSVYQGIENGIVKYVGITKRDPTLRWAEHEAAGGPKSSLFYYGVDGATGLTRTQARVWEQNLINQHGLPNLYNQINSIAPANWWMYGVTP